MSSFNRSFDGQTLTTIPLPAEPGVSFVPNFVPPVPVWTGSPVEGVTIDSLIQSEMASWPPSGDEIQSALTFYDGWNQWPEKMKADRLAAGRPCLVVNRLPGLAAAIIRSSTVSGEPFNQERSIWLTTILVRRYRAAQMAYNSMASSWVEAGCKIVTSVEEKNVHNITS